MSVHTPFDINPDIRILLILSYPCLIIRLRAEKFYNSPFPNIIELIS